MSPIHTTHCTLLRIVISFLPSFRHKLNVVGKISIESKDTESYTKSSQVRSVGIVCQIANLRYGYMYRYGCKRRWKTKTKPVDASRRLKIQEFNHGIWQSKR
jgi:hypothetical protein